jgi:hypothetical protein
VWEERFETFPCLITGNPDAMKGTESLRDNLFGVCKERRNSFVHCEPGPEKNKRGYVKEELFHDPGSAQVKETLVLTVEAITKVWEIIHSRKGPRWLRSLGEDGRFPEETVGLVVKEGYSQQR